ncbi:sn-glycerol-1-phosphate dehydrogenase [Ruania alba]|uniref:Glycerol-1-phosphate dehydrogenase [NAD(P)+] n=1 Tax=Ruania alba TaxID=648782 RepID=A0A1H5MCL8_9MICO|nr:sn-glycerol-1-phosphate dehydrogenase [Ruania alba]SEE87034.1 glycerol-1-phosphate dehydrogenase [NAD(P)+] [Ruania alba]
MSLIDQALADATDTRAIAIGTDVLESTGAVYAELFGTRTAIVVADENTWAVAGAAVTSSLEAAGVPLVEPYVFPGVPTLYASYENVSTLREHLRPLDAIAVSIASGTLNDLTKLASGELEREYLNVATAASMDGYTAYGSSITKDGFKQTIFCPAPAGLVADQRILAAAPPRLTATGVGDLIEKVPAGADWIIADELGIEPIEQGVWDLVQGPLRASLSNPEGLRDGDTDAISGLTEGLIMSGLSMQAYQSSRPASGAGHQFSHLWEMEKLGMDDEPPLSHGMKVGLGTISLCALYEVVLRRDLAGVDVEAAVAAWPSWSEREAQIRATFPDDLVEATVAQSRAKHLEAEQLRERLALVQQKWPQIAERVREQLLPAAEIERILDVVGAVTHPAQIGVDAGRFRETYFRAQAIRSRYTLLDLLFETGLLTECVDELFADGGFWAERPWS